MNPKNTWADFKAVCQDKKLILYGLGSLLNYLFIRCSEEIEIIAAIDNDSSKQGHKLCDFFDDVDLKHSKDIMIDSRESLNRFNPKETVILISSLRHSESIANDVEKLGFFCCFSVLHLEHNYKEQIRNENLPIDDQDSYMLDYAKRCIEKFPVENNKIIFGGMDRYPDHGRYITEKLLSMNKNLDIVWVMNTPFGNVPEGVRIIYEGKWKQYIYELETAKFWIFNMVIRTPILKRSEQIYIQLKHWGSLTLKTFYLNEKIGNLEEDIWKANGKMIDYIAVDLVFMVNFFALVHQEVIHYLIKPNISTRFIENLDWTMMKKF